MRKSPMYHLAWFTMAISFAFGLISAIDLFFLLFPLPVRLAGVLLLSLEIVAFTAGLHPLQAPYGLWVLKDGEYYALKSIYTSGSTAGSTVAAFINPHSPADILHVKVEDSFLKEGKLGAIYRKKGSSLVLAYKTQADLEGFKNGEIDWKSATA